MKKHDFWKLFLFVPLLLALVLLCACQPGKGIPPSQEAALMAEPAPENPESPDATVPAGSFLPTDSILPESGAPSVLIPAPESPEDPMATIPYSTMAAGSFSFL